MSADDTPLGIDHPTVQVDDTTSDDEQLPIETRGYVTLDAETFEQLLYWGVYTGYERAKNVEELDPASERVIDSTFEEFLANNAADSTRAFKEVPDAAPTYGRDAVERVEGRAESRSTTRRGEQQ